MNNALGHIVTALTRLAHVLLQREGDIVLSEHETLAKCHWMIVGSLTACFFALSFLSLEIAFEEDWFSDSFWSFNILIFGVLIC